MTTISKCSIDLMWSQEKKQHEKNLSNFEANQLK